MRLVFFICAVVVVIVPALLMGVYEWLKNCVKRIKIRRSQSRIVKARKHHAEEYKQRLIDEAPMRQKLEEQRLAEERRLAEKRKETFNEWLSIVHEDEVKKASKRK